MKIHIRRVVSLVIFLSLTLTTQLHADCRIIGSTADGGYVIVCTGTDLIGISGSACSDEVSITAGATVDKTDQRSSATTAAVDVTSTNAGDGDNQVISDGSINAGADAEATPAAGQPSQAAATATAIAAKDGADALQNNAALSATAVAQAESDDVSLDLEDDGTSESMTLSTATASGIRGGGGQNAIANTGTIAATATSNAEAPYIDLSFEDSADADVSVEAKAAGTGISGAGSIENTQTGSVSVQAAAEAFSELITANIRDSATADAGVTAQASAAGLAGSAEDDVITNDGTLAVNAASAAEGGVKLESSSDAAIAAAVSALSDAVGIESGTGDDTITNRSSLNTTAAASSASDNINTILYSPGITDTTVQSVGKATGITGNDGRDTISNDGTVTVYAGAASDLSNVLLSGAIAVALATDVKGGATAEASAAGIDGGDDNDRITNHTVLNSSSDASASSEAVLLSPASIGTFAAPTTATAGSTGIRGGDGEDDLANPGTIAVNASSTTEALSLSFSGLQYEAAADGDMKTASAAKATGMDGGDGNDKISHTGSMSTTADATSSTTEISAEIVGASFSNASTTAQAHASGIDAGAGADDISTSGTITARADSEVNSLGIDVKYFSIPLQPAEWLGADLGEAQTAAQSTAVGIDGDSGNDTITNTSILDIGAQANATSDKIAAKINLSSTSNAGGAPAALSIASSQNPPDISLQVETTESVGTGSGQAENTIMDAGTTAQATATGIAGGDGADHIVNNEQVSVKGESESDSLSIAASLSIGKGSLMSLIPNYVIIDAATYAQTSITGIDGGDGQNIIDNTADLSADATANATSVSLGVALSGATEPDFLIGIAVSDASTGAVSDATGIAGGDDDDVITNSGNVKAAAAADADAASISVALAASGKEGGLTGAGTYADATTTADASAVGIDGGAGQNTMDDSGEIEATAEATSSSASIGVSAAGVKEGAGFAVALTDGTTTATSSAAGLISGDGGDTITVANKTTVSSYADADSASVSLSIAGTSDGIVAAGTYANATTEAEANAVGIEAGGGSDTVQHSGLLSVTSDAAAASASIGVSVAGAAEGAAVGVSLSKVETNAKAAGIGIDGGGGEDALTNTGTVTVGAKSDVTTASVSVDFAASGTGIAAGVSLADGDTTVESSAIGIDGGAGRGILSNQNILSCSAESNSTLASISLAVHGTPEGVSLGAALADASNTARATAIGIDGGDEHDQMTNTGTLTVGAKTDADTASVALDAELAPVGIGASLARADTTAEAAATALSGASGSDEMTNSGTIDVDADASSSSKAISISIATASFSLSDLSTTAAAVAKGLEGGDGEDTLCNEGSIGLNADSSADGKAGSANLAGYAAANVDITGEATAIGMDSGAADADAGVLLNTGDIDALSNAKANGLAVSVNLLGGVASNANTTAKATTDGIKGGSGADQIQNSGAIHLSAKSNADVTGVSVTLGGYADANAESMGISVARGIEGGDGINNITNDAAGSIDLTSEASADTASVSVSLLGYAKASGGATGTAAATGIAGGNDTDTIQNAGGIDLTALSSTDASATTVQLIGYGDSNAESKGETIGKGIDGGNGNNAITNAAGGHITVQSTTTAHANSYTINLMGGAAAKAGTSAMANAIGIEGGNAIDAIQNDGLIALTTQSNVDASSTSIDISGSGTANAASKADTSAIGIDGGKGENTITNTQTGSILVSANAGARAIGVTVNVGIGLADAGTASKTGATGIKSEDGEDTILNEGTVTVTAAGKTEAGSGTVGLAEFALADSLTEVILEGIQAGNGNNQVENSGILTIGDVPADKTPLARAVTETISFSFLGFGSATLGARVYATGVSTGTGDDTIFNTGALTVGDDDWMTSTLSVGVTNSYLGLASTGTIAETHSKGIESGSGNDRIVNTDTGTMTIKATAYSKSEGSAEAVFGMPMAKADSSSITSSTGIDSAEGSHVIENQGTLDVDAYARADGSAEADVGWGSPKAEAEATAEATATGIRTGSGHQTLSNTGNLDVRAAADTIPYAEADTDIDDNTAQAYSDATATAYGTKTDSGDDVIVNEGGLNVEAVAEKATAGDQRTTAWADEEAKVGTGKSNPGIQSSSSATGIAAGSGANQIANKGDIEVKAVTSGNGYAYAESDAYDTDTAIWAIIDATATGMATDQGKSRLLNEGPLKILAQATADISSDSDSVDDADATGGGTATATAWGIHAAGSDTLVINDSTLEVDAVATFNGSSRADSAGDGYGEAALAPASDADAVGIAAGNGGTVWNKAGNQITVDAKAVVNATANGDEFGTMGSSKANPGATAAAAASGISLGEGDQAIVNEGSFTVYAEGNISAGTRSLSTTRSTHTTAWARADASSAGWSADRGDVSMANTGTLQVDAKAVVDVNGTDSGWGTYWRSDSWYNADAKAGAYANTNAIGIDAGADNTGDPKDVEIANSGTVSVTSAATAKGNAAGDRGGTSDGTATTYAEARADVSGFVVGMGNYSAAIDNSGTLDVAATADTMAFSHGDSDSWSYAKSQGFAYGITIGDGNERVSIRNTGTVKVTSATTADASDDEPWRQTEAFSHVWGIDIGDSNSMIANTGILEIDSQATAKLYTDENTAVYTASSASATGIHTDDGTHHISNDSHISVVSTAANHPNGGNANSTNMADAQVMGIATGSGSDVILLGADSSIDAAAGVTTDSYNGVTTAAAVGIDAGDGANQIANLGLINVNAQTTAEVKRFEISSIIYISMNFPASAESSATGIKTGLGADRIGNDGNLTVNAEAYAVTNQEVQYSQGTKTAAADVIGIEAGTGDNVISNDGTIEVCALAAAGTGDTPQERTDGTESTTAVGITTGAGNDTITNNGTIKTVNQRLEWVGGNIHITNRAGIAITTGDGDDVLTLGGGSTTTGAIDLGEGDDTLRFTGTATINGTIDPGTGSNSLVFDGTGSSSYAFTDFENTTKQGVGTFTLNGLPTMKRMDITEGVLQINSDYAMTGDSAFRTGINGSGGHGRLSIDGTATLAGSLTVTRERGLYFNGTTYDIIRADQVANAFDTVTLPDPNVLVSFTMHQDPNALRIETQAKSFAFMAANPIEAVIARYLDTIQYGATGDLLNVLIDIQNLPEEAFSRTFASLSPEAFDTFTRATFGVTGQMHQSFRQRMEKLRIAARTPAKPVLLAYQGSDWGRFGKRSPSDDRYPAGLWLNVFGQRGEQQGDPTGHTGYDFSVAGATLGADLMLSDRLTAGFGVAHGETKIDLNNPRGDGNIESLISTAYGSYFTKNFYLDGVLSFGRNRYENHRTIIVGSLQRNVESSHRGDLFSARLGGGYDVALPGLSLGPFASLQYSRLHEDRFTEEGGGSLSLTVEGRKTDALVSEAGLRFRGTFDGDRTSFIPELTVAWLHDFAVDDRVITASFSGSPGASFSIPGQALEQNGATVGASFTLVYSNGLSTSLRYGGEFRNGFYADGVIGEIRFAF
ncbi:MAG: autotransporter domain-containing protein [Deltaproteobacteria bacterium]|nr:autotransporter domain-containing protein [Deltaproteobacteria bacterium]